ncbi:hypothetical protein EDD85DRAFT_796366 [Armillaria nabsnona]|nr:hypothetical protein EDD85DRAFT_796366 [Armillaria nabsnona]
MAAGPQSFQLYHFSRLPRLDHHFGDQNRVNRLSNSVQDQYAGGILLTAIRRHGEWLRAHGVIKLSLTQNYHTSPGNPKKRYTIRGYGSDGWATMCIEMGRRASKDRKFSYDRTHCAQWMLGNNPHHARSYKPRAKRTESFRLGKKVRSMGSEKQLKEAETSTTKHLAHRSLGLIRIVFDPHQWCMDLELLNLSYAKASKRNQLTIEFGDDVVVKEKNCLCKSRMHPGSSPMSSPGPAAFCAWFRPSQVAGDVDISPESQPPMEMKGGPNSNDKESPTLEAGKDSRSSVPFSRFKVRRYREVEVEDEYIMKEIGEKMQRELEVAKCKRSFDGKKQRRLAD